MNVLESVYKVGKKHQGDQLEVVSMVEVSITSVLNWKQWWKLKDLGYGKVFKI